MRTFPKSLAEFRKLVERRCDVLRQLDYNQLRERNDASVEELIFDSRSASITTIVEHMPDNLLRIVVQGFMDGRFIGKHVALDGFYKNPDGSLGQMPDEEFYEFD